MSDVIELAKEIMACPSVTPADAGAQGILSARLRSAGFEVYSLPFGEGEERIENMFARIGTAGPHLCYGGHTDVVPPGPLEKWSSHPFEPEIRDGVLYGRGASDMKGSVAAFTIAAINYVEKHGAPEHGSISMLITGDEEADAINGTVKVLDWMKENGHTPDVALVGEPTNQEELGEEMKVGRRGSLTGKIRVQGRQGHVAYPHRAQNPIPAIAKLVDALSSYEFDQGTEFFVATNLEVTTIDVGNTAENVIPDEARAQFNIRFNDTWSEASLTAKIREILDSVGAPYEVSFACSGESFLTDPSDWTALVRKAVEEKTGRRPAYTTTGGTSDARFFTKLCPVVEFGPILKSIHKIDENARVDHLDDLTEIYERILELYLQGA